MVIINTGYPRFGLQSGDVKKIKYKHLTGDGKFDVEIRSRVGITKYVFQKVNKYQETGKLRSSELKIYVISII